MSSGSPLDDVLLGIESAIHLRKRDVGGLLAPIEAALAAYRLAAETEAAREYCAAHSLPAPRGAVLSRSLSAERLAQAVAALPELPSALSSAVSASASSERSSTDPLAAPSSAHRSEPRASAVPTCVTAALPNLVRAVKNGRLVVIGAFAGRVRTLPEPLGTATDFIDTARDGVHAVGNLPQRLRQGRIVGVVICDLAISHQHSEPVVHAARAAHIPVGFAGKGGNAALARALESLEAQLGG